MTDKITVPFVLITRTYYKGMPQFYLLLPHEEVLSKEVIGIVWRKQNGEIDVNISNEIEPDVGLNSMKNLAITEVHEGLTEERWLSLHCMKYGKLELYK